MPNMFDPVFKTPANVTLWFDRVNPFFKLNVFDFYSVINRHHLTCCQSHFLYNVQYIQSLCVLCLPYMCAIYAPYIPCVSISFQLDLLVYATSNIVSFMVINVSCHIKFVEWRRTRVCGYALTRKSKVVQLTRNFSCHPIRLKSSSVDKEFQSPSNKNLTPLTQQLEQLGCLNICSFFGRLLRIWDEQAFVYQQLKQ